MDAAAAVRGPVRVRAVVAVAGRYGLAALVSFGRRCLQKMRRCVAKMFSASESVRVRVDLENVRARPFVETGRARGAGVSRMNASSC